VSLPKAIFLDLDDTILDDTGSVQACWEEACQAYAPKCQVPPGDLLAAINRSSQWFWSDPERHRLGRLDLRVARTEVVRLAFADLGLSSVEFAEKIAGIYHDRRDDGIALFPDSVQTIRWLRDCDCRLALLTNGGGVPQRAKIRRFDLEGYFHAIFIEGEVGFGKPDERIYNLALQTLGLSAHEVWMVGDNIEWDVVQPKRLGIRGIWIDRHGKGHPKLDTAKPDRIIRTLSDLRVHA
jgi:putative hydrolase of the HAD superfamily